MYTPTYPRRPLGRTMSRMKLVAVAVLALGAFVIWFNLNTTPRGWPAVGSPS
jgi:hypothetical protein